MAAKKGAQIHFQIDVATNEEWNKLLEKTGLIVADIHSEWCGPCTAMISSLKKLKMEMGNDYLHFALVKSSGIDDLQRFRDKSEPTWMFIAGGQLVNLMFGVDAPALIQVIKEELKKETLVLEGKEKRKSFPFNQLTEAEREREAIIIRKNEQKDELYKHKLAIKENIIRERSLRKLAKMLPNHSCIIYFSHMISKDGNCVVAQKMMYLNDSISATVVDQMIVQLDKTTIPRVFYKCPVFENFSENFISDLENKPIFVTLLQTITNDEVPEITSPRIVKNEIELNSIEQKLSKMIYGAENSTEFTENSVAYEFIVETENGDKLPPMWTPTNALSKASVIEVLFPRKLEAIGYIPEQLPPPQLIVIYDASKALDVLEIVKEYEEDVYKIGFFDSIDPQNAKLVSKTYEKFKNSPDNQTKNIKIVVALKKKDENDLLLEFSQVIPLYVSPNEKVGTDESECFFPFDYDDDDEEEEIEITSNKEATSEDDTEQNLEGEEKLVNGDGK